MALFSFKIEEMIMKPREQTIAGRDLAVRILNISGYKMTRASIILTVVVLTTAISVSYAVHGGIICYDPPCYSPHHGLQTRQYLPPPDGTEIHTQKREDRSRQSRSIYRPPTDPDWVHGQRVYRPPGDSDWEYQGLLKSILNGRR